MAASPILIPRPGASSPALSLHPPPPLASSLGTINEVSSTTDLVALNELLDCGAPTSGQYAKNGLWDDESDSDKEHREHRDREHRDSIGATSSNNTGSTSSGRSWRQRLSSTSVKAPGKRSRSGTLTGTSSPAPDGSWPWNRKMSFSANVANAPPPLVSPPLASPIPPPLSAPLNPPVGSPFAAPPTSLSQNASPNLPLAPVMPSAPIFPSSPVIPTLFADTPKVAPTPSPKVTTILIAHPIPEPASTGSSLKPSKSRSRLRSMGMRPKASAPDLLKKAAENNTPETTPAERSPLQPMTNLSTMRAAQNQVLQPATKHTAPIVEKRLLVEDPKPKSAWKRGVERLWRSKSASGLRESFQRRPEIDVPPVPPLPRHQKPPHTSVGLTIPTGPAGHSTVSLGLSMITRSPSMRESVLVVPAPHDDPIYSELDKRYPSFPARAPPGPSPVVADEETFESDPFASAVDYASAPRPPSRASRLSRSPIPDFSSTMPTQLDVSRPVSIKGGLIPRLRKSKSMAISGRPSSIVGLFTDRKKSTGPSPRVSPLACFEPMHPGVDDLGMGCSPSDLEPPKPLFYDMFDIASDDETRDETSPQSSWDPQVEQPFESPSPPSLPSAEVAMPLSAPPYLASQAPDLLIESGVAAAEGSGENIDIATPVPCSAPAHVTSYNELELDGVFLPAAVNSKRLSNNPPPPDSIDISVSLSTSSIDDHQRAPRESASFNDLYRQLGIGPEQAEQWLVDQLPERQAITTPRDLATDDPARDDHSACDPSPLSTPGASWETAIRSFSNIDDHFLAPSSTFPTSYNSDVDYTCNVSIDELDMGSFQQASTIDSESIRSVSSRGAMPPSDSSRPTTSRPSQDRTHAHTTASDWTSWRDMRRGGSDSRSRSSSRERRPHVTAHADNGWSIESDSDEAAEQDDVPLSKLHPAAGAAQQQRLVDAVRRREARRAERERELRHTKSQLFDRERERLVKRERELQRAASQRDSTRSSRSAAPEWNGEGGVPADVLAGRLERVAVSSSQARQASSSTGVSRAPTVRHPAGGSSTQPPARPPRLTRTSQDDSPLSPATPNYSSSMSRTPTIGGNSIHNSSSRHQGERNQGERQHADANRGAPLSRATTSSTSGHSPSTSLGRANTTSRRRTASNVRDQPSPADPPPVPRRGVPVRCVIATSSGEKPLAVEVFPETTARDVLSRAREAAHLVDGSKGPTSGWVVCEVFSELNLERQLREYETICNVTRGWDAQANGNRLCIRESHHANQTLAKAVSDSAPFVGGWVQLETKRGKWSKRWLETRGGHIFISKNEKGKDELQINTIFSDVYTPTGDYPCPQRHVFALKRLEPLSSFENPTEHIHYVSTDDATGWKLSTASFASRSYTLVSAQKHAQISHSTHSQATLQPHPVNHATSLKRSKSQSQTSHSHPHSEREALTASLTSSGGTIRRPARQQPAPLVDLKAGMTRQPTNQPLVDFKGASGFTGKGLLGNI